MINEFLKKRVENEYLRTGNLEMVIIRKKNVLLIHRKKDLNKTFGDILIISIYVLYLVVLLHFFYCFFLSYQYESCLFLSPPSSSVFFYRWPVFSFDLFFSFSLPLFSICCKEEDVLIVSGFCFQYILI